MATPDPASASTKKRSKKRKTADGEANSEQPPEEDLQTPAMPATASAPTKKKHKRKAAAAADPSNEAEAEADAAGPTEAATPTKAAVDASPSLNVTVDASLTGGRTDAPAPAPAVAYFPTGYDPLAAAAKEEGGSGPNARLFRHEKHPTWVDLVVRSSGGGPDFVGRSYAGEAATPQLCEYALGVLDKASGTLRVVPIAANKVSILSD
jgi:DNA-directed RNA polymerase I subunit RPA49